MGGELNGIAKESYGRRVGWVGAFHVCAGYDFTSGKPHGKNLVLGACGELRDLLLRGFQAVNAASPNGLVVREFLENVIVVDGHRKRSPPNRVISPWNAASIAQLARRALFTTGHTQHASELRPSGRR